MAKISVLGFLDSKDPGPTTISNRGGVCSSGDATTGVPPVPGTCAIAVVVGVGVAVTTTVVVVVEVDGELLEVEVGVGVGVGVGEGRNARPGLLEKLLLAAFTK